MHSRQISYLVFTQTPRSDSLPFPPHKQQTQNFLQIKAGFNRLLERGKDSLTYNPKIGSHLLDVQHSESLNFSLDDRQKGRINLVK